MSSDLSALVSKVKAIVQDPGFTEDDIVTALNDAMNIISSGVQRPDSSILTSPLPGLYAVGTVSTLTTTYCVVLPTNYQRDVVFAADSYGRELQIYDSFLEYSRTYPLMNQSGSVNALAIKGGYLYYQPTPTVAQVITVHYHRSPVDMTVGTSVPDGISAQYHNLLVYHVVKDFFSTIEDGIDGGMANSQKWEAKFMQMMMRMEASIPNDAGITIF
jgi:hypothetical protein